MKSLMILISLLLGSHLISGWVIRQGNSVEPLLVDVEEDILGPLWGGECDDSDDCSALSHCYDFSDDVESRCYPDWYFFVGAGVLVLLLVAGIVACICCPCCCLYLCCKKTFKCLCCCCDS